MTQTKIREIREDLTEAERELIPQPTVGYYHDPELKIEVAQDIRERRPVMFTGHAGTGKSSFIIEMAAVLKIPVLRMNLNGQATIADFVGYNTVIDGNIVWIDGVLTQAIRRGYWLIVDEIDSGEPAILTILNAITEKNGFLTLKEKGCDIVKPHEKFRLFATANTVGIMESYSHMYLGTNRMNQALVDRFCVYHMEYLPEDKEIEVLQALTGIPEDSAVFLVQLANNIREAFTQNTISTTFSLRSLISLAEMFLRLVNRAHKLKEAGKPYDTTSAIMQKVCKYRIYSKISAEDGATIKSLITKMGVPS